jgi:hypothetical protein
MEEKEITPEDGIALIQAMIGKTKSNISYNSFYYIFWGWLVFAAALVHYISLKYLWIGFGLAIAVVMASMGVHGIKVTYFCLMVLYGLATFIAGGVLAFPPLVFGGLSSLTCAVFSIFLSNEDQLLCIAVALLLSFIIPGHLLALKHKQQ